MIAHVILLDVLPCAIYYKTSQFIEAGDAFTLQ